MKRSASEIIKNGYFNLERLSRSFRLVWPGISALERLWNSFVSDAELFMCRTKCIKLIMITNFEAETESVLGSAVERLLRPCPP